MTAFSGVRSSCDMLARNSDLCRLATSSRRLLCCSARNVRALWIATADWLASVSRRSTVREGNAPVTFRRTSSAPMISCSHCSGIASSERQPAAASFSRWGSEGSSARSAVWSGAASAAARPTNVSSMWIRVAASLGHQTGIRPDAGAQRE